MIKDYRKIIYTIILLIIVIVIGTILLFKNTTTIGTIKPHTYTEKEVEQYAKQAHGSNTRNLKKTSKIQIDIDAPNNQKEHVTATVYNFARENGEIFQIMTYPIHKKDNNGKIIESYLRNITDYYQSSLITTYSENIQSIAQAYNLSLQIDLNNISQNKYDSCLIFNISDLKEAYNIGRVMQQINELLAIRFNKNEITKKYNIEDIVAKIHYIDEQNQIDKIVNIPLAQSQDDIEDFDANYYASLIKNNIN